MTQAGFEPNGIQYLPVGGRLVITKPTRLLLLISISQYTTLLNKLYALQLNSSGHPIPTPPEFSLVEHLKLPKHQGAYGTVSDLSHPLPPSPLPYNPDCPNKSFFLLWSRIHPPTIFGCFPLACDFINDMIDGIVPTQLTWITKGAMGVVFVILVQPISHQFVV